MNTGFQYFEIRPAVDTGDSTQSFLGEAEHCPARGADIYTPRGAEREARAYQVEHGGTLVWTIYGRHMDGGCMVADAVGDFTTFDGALTILNHILAPMAAARDKLESMPHDGAGPRPLIPAACDLDDVINQSSTEERL